MKLLWKAIATSLRADATLVSLTAYASDNISIGRGFHPTAKVVPGLYFMEDPDDGYLTATNSNKIKQWDVTFTAVAETDIVCGDIARAFELLFEDSDLKDEYWDFSNDDIDVIFSKIVNMGTCSYSDELERWSCTITVQIKWAYK